MSPSRPTDWLPTNTVTKSQRTSHLLTHFALCNPVSVWKCGTRVSLFLHGYHRSQVTRSLNIPCCPTQRALAVAHPASPRPAEAQRGLIVHGWRSMPTTVVTGAAGRLGGGIAAALRRRGHRLVGVDIVQPPAEAAGTFHDFFISDLSAAAVTDSPAGRALEAACAGADVVVHCAAWPCRAGPPHTSGGVRRDRLSISGSRKQMGAGSIADGGLA